jgi:hypothetical protein
LPKCRCWKSSQIREAIQRAFHHQKVIHQFLSISRKAVWNITTRSVGFEVARHYGFRAKGPAICIAQAEGLGNETKQIP